MLRVICDSCGKELLTEEAHHVVKIEVFAAAEAAGLTEADLDEDHMEAVGEILREMEENGQSPTTEPRSRQLRFDVCAACRERFLRDPLGREHSTKLLFSKN